MPKTDRRPALYASYEHAAQIVSNVSADQLDGPTPCPAYTVSDLVDHFSVPRPGPRLWAGASLKPLVLSPTSSSRRSSAAAPFRRRGRGGLVERRASGGHGAHALGRDLHRCNTGRHVPGRDDCPHVGPSLCDRAAGRLDPALAGPALDGARTMMKPEYRNVMGEGNPFASEVPAPDDSTPWDIWPHLWAATPGLRPGPSLLVAGAPAQARLGPSSGSATPRFPPRPQPICGLSSPGRGRPYVGVIRCELLHDGHIVDIEDERGPVRWVSESTGQHQLAPLMGLSRQLEVFLAKRWAAVHVIVDEVILEQVVHTTFLCDFSAQRTVRPNVLITQRGFSGCF